MDKRTFMMYFSYHRNEIKRSRGTYMLYHDTKENVATFILDIKSLFTWIREARINDYFD